MQTPGSTGHLHGDPPPPPGGSHIRGLVQPGCGWGHGPVTCRPPGFTLDQGAPSSWVPAQTTQESWGAQQRLAGPCRHCPRLPILPPRLAPGFWGLCAVQGQRRPGRHQAGHLVAAGNSTPGDLFPFLPTGREAREVRGTRPARGCPGAPRQAPPQLSCVLPLGEGDQECWAEPSCGYLTSKMDGLVSMMATMILSM